MTAIKDVPLNDIVTEIRRLAAESPDYVYERPGQSCVYVEYIGDELIGSCIVGKALVNLGVNPADLLFEEIPGAYNLLRNPVKMAPEQVWWIDTVQGAQDDGTPWAESVAAADETHPLEARS
jgi:hypothetical protein